MPGHEPLGGIRGALIDVEGAPDSHHQREQQQRESDAEHSQYAAPLVAECVSHDKASDCHSTYPIWRRPCTMFVREAWYAGRAALRKLTNPATSIDSSHRPGVTFSGKKLRNFGE